MRYFASKNAVTTADKSSDPAWAEITAEQHEQAIEALVSGREVIVNGGFATRDKRPSEFHEWEDGEWVDKTPEPEPEPPYLPRSTAMWRARAIAKVTPHGNGTLFDAVVTAIAGMTDPLVQAAASEAWERGTTFDLDGHLVPVLMGALGMTEEDVVPLIDAAESLPA